MLGKDLGLHLYKIELAEETNPNDYHCRRAESHGYKKYRCIRKKL